LASSPLYRREWYVIIGDHKSVGLRLKFKVEKTLLGEPNTLDLHVYNLSADTRAKMQKRGVPVVLVAGYQGAAQVIFSGDAQAVDHLRDGPNWDTHIQSGDGAEVFRTAFSSHSFKAGTTWKDVAGTVAKDLGVNVGDAVSKLGTGDFAGAIDTFLQGYTAHGPAVAEFDRVMRAGGLEWSIQDGKLQIVKGRNPTAEDAILLSPKTGLIGSPDHGSPEKDGQPSLLKVRSLLQGGIRPGRAVVLESASVRGRYRAAKVTHEGDTHGGEWYTGMELEPL
jgi:hypothetical protein